MEARWTDNYKPYRLENERKINRKDKAEEKATAKTLSLGDRQMENPGPDSAK